MIFKTYNEIVTEIIKNGENIGAIIDGNYNSSYNSMTDTLGKVRLTPDELRQIADFCDQQTKEEE